MIEVLRTKSCGIRELNGITSYSTPKQIIDFAIPTLCGINGCFATFSAPLAARDVYTGNPQDYPSNIGIQLRDYIESNRLGKVISIPPQFNPNSGRVLAMYVWMWDERLLNAYRDKGVLEKTLVSIDLEIEQQESMQKSGVTTIPNSDVCVGLPIIHKRYGTGSIVAFDGSKSHKYGVRFDSPQENFHNLSGKLETSHGLWMSDKFIKVDAAAISKKISELAIERTNAEQELNEINNIINSVYAERGFNE